MIRVLVADDHAVVRSGLMQIIGTSCDIEVAGEAASGGEVMERLRATRVDVLVLDLAMPGIAGIALIRRILTDRVSLPILVFTIHDQSVVVTRALRAGAKGYLTKDADPDAILMAIRKVSSSTDVGKRKERQRCRRGFLSQRKDH
jgi:DNA-binding NarL/FixJ family response regulator